MPSPARVLVVDDSPTILKVVSSILARHGYEPAVARDGLAGIELLRRDPAFDLVLLDFVMPRMNGYQFCRELRASPETGAVPVVLMSAKGDKIRGQFVQQTGAVDAITKPFEPRALIAVVEGALAKTAEARQRAAEDARRDTAPDTEADGERSEPRAGADGMPQRMQGAAVAALGGAVASAVAALPPEQRGSDEAVRRAVESVLTLDALRALGIASREAELLLPGPKGKEVMAGDLVAVPFAEVLQVLHLGRQTGVLRVTNQRAIVTIALQKGAVDLAHERGAPPERKLGRYFVERGIVRRDELEALLALRQPRSMRLGEALVRAGLATPADVSRALARQSSDIVYEVLRWQLGRFSFSIEPFRPEAERAALGLSVPGLVLEGFRRVDEWRLMEESMRLDQVVELDAGALGALDIATMTRPERLVVDAIDGARTLADVVRTSEVGTFEAAKIVYQLLERKVARMRGAA